MKRTDLKIFGILNITEDSFSDGGLYFNSENAIAHTKELIEAGADVIDLGPAASNPEAKQVSSQEEITRIGPVLEKFGKEVPFSLDSYNPETQLWAIKKGIDYLNDIHGFPIPEIYPDLAKSKCRLIVMHSTLSGWKADRNYTNPDLILSRILEFFKQRISELVDAGISRERIIIDPGMGYFLGSNPEASIRVLRGISDLRKKMGTPVMISVSRKSFLRSITGRTAAESLPATLAAEIFAANSGVDYIRTHDVRALNDALKVLQVLWIR